MSNYLELAAIEALETSCFLFADLATEDDDLSSDGPVLATVHFNGPRIGYLQLECDNQLLPELAENMLGDEHAPHELQLDALGELANIICGSVLPHLSDEPRFRIGAPIVGEGAVVSPPARAAATLNVNGAPFRAFLDWAPRPVAG